MLARGGTRPPPRPRPGIPRPRGAIGIPRPPILGRPRPPAPGGDIGMPRPPPRPPPRPRPGAIGMPRPRPAPGPPILGRPPAPGGDIGPPGPDGPGRWPGMPRGAFGRPSLFALTVPCAMPLKFGRRGIELLLLPPPEPARENGSSPLSPLKLELDVLRAMLKRSPLDARPAIFWKAVRLPVEDRLTPGPPGDTRLFPGPGLRAPPPPTCDGRGIAAPGPLRPIGGSFGGGKPVPRAPPSPPPGPPALSAGSDDNPTCGFPPIGPRPRCGAWSPAPAGMPGIFMLGAARGANGSVTFGAAVGAAPVPPERFKNGSGLLRMATIPGGLFHISDVSKLTGLPSAPSPFQVIFFCRNAFIARLFSARSVRLTDE